MNKKRILKGDILFSKNKEELVQIKDGYLLVDGESIVTVCKTKEEMPKDFEDILVEDYSEQLIIPGLIDLHVHAPQYTFRALGMDMELLPWLNRYAFPEEKNYKDTEYAKKSYQVFVEDLKNSATTRAGIFGTIHRESTEILMDLIEKSGLYAYVGKVNMDRNSPDYLIEETKESIEETKRWIQESKEKYKRVLPMLTPRFVPSCTAELMKELGQISKEQKLPVQSHLSENKGEIAWVKELHPETSCYAEAYDEFGLFGNEQNTIMAHCVYSALSEREMELLKQQKVWIAHCPESNMNLTSGLAPVKKFLKEGICVGLGSDVAGGTKLSIFSAMADAIRVSKLYKLYVDEEEDILTIPEVFYMATLLGGSFFGKVGTFENGYDFDAVILDDSKINRKGLTLFERLERVIYYGEQGMVVKKFVKGVEI